MKKLLSIYILFIIFLLFYSPSIIKKIRLTRIFDGYLYLNSIYPEDPLIQKRIESFSKINNLNATIPSPKYSSEFVKEFTINNKDVLLARKYERDSKTSKKNDDIGNAARFTRTNKLSELTPLSFSPTPKTEKVETSENLVDALDMIIPADMIYIKFNDFETMHSAIKYFDNTIVPLYNAKNSSEPIFPLKETIELETDLNLNKLNKSQHLFKMTKVAILLDDFDLRKGADVTLIFEFENAEMAERFYKRHKLYTFDKPNNAEPPMLFDKFFITSSGKNHLTNIVATQEKKTQSAINYTAGFAHLSQGIDHQGEINIFIPEDYIKKVTSPEYYIKKKRQETCLHNINMLNTAFIMFESLLAEFIIPDIELLRETGDMSYFPLCNDGGEYYFVPGKFSFKCSVHGMLTDITKRSDLRPSKSARNISQFEKSKYNAFKAQYFKNIQLEPTAIAFDFSDDSKVSVSAAIYPLSGTKSVPPLKGIKSSSVDSLGDINAFFANVMKVRVADYIYNKDVVFNKTGTKSYISEILEKKSPEFMDDYYSMFAKDNTGYKNIFLGGDKLREVAQQISTKLNDSIDNSCERNLARLQNTYDLHSMVSDVPPILYDIMYDKYSNLLVCYAGGKYFLKDSEVICSIHGKVMMFKHRQGMEFIDIFNNIKRFSIGFILGDNDIKMKVFGYR